MTWQPRWSRYKPGGHSIAEWRERLTHVVDGATFGDEAPIVSKRNAETLLAHIERLLNKKSFRSDT